MEKNEPRWKKILQDMGPATTEHGDVVGTEESILTRIDELYHNANLVGTEESILDRAEELVRERGGADGVFWSPPIIALVIALCEEIHRRENVFHELRNNTWRKIGQVERRLEELENLPKFLASAQARIDRVEAATLPVVNAMRERLEAEEVNRPETPTPLADAADEFGAACAEKFIEAMDAVLDQRSAGANEAAKEDGFGVGVTQSITSDDIDEAVSGLVKGLVSEGVISPPCGACAGQWNDTTPHPGPDWRESTCAVHIAASDLRHALATLSPGPAYRVVGLGHLVEMAEAMLAAVRVPVVGEKSSSRPEREHYVSAITPSPPAKDGAALIAAERRRQVEEEGFTTEDDRAHEDGDLAVAGACYAIFNTTAVPVDRVGTGYRRRWAWPWRLASWKPKSRLRNLIRGGALIAAEIDRLLRAG